MGIIDTTGLPIMPKKEAQFFSLAQIMQWDIVHCLRPTLTQILFKTLLVERQSANLTGNSGHGKSRTMEDVRKIAKAQGIQVALLNLKECRLDYLNFLKSLAIQLELKKINFESFSVLTDELFADKNRFFLVLIDNLEVLNDYKSNDPRYNAQFVSSLNLLKDKKENILLLCASREWLNYVHFDNETLLLALHRLEINTLSQEEISRELHRRLAPHDLLANESQQRQVRKAVQDSKKPYTRLEMLISKLKTLYTSRNFDKQLKTWLNDER